MGIFPPVFSDCVDILLPCQSTPSQPIAFGLIVPNVTPKITCARAHHKYVMYAKQLSILEIIRVYDQYDLGQFGVIPSSQAMAC